MPSLLASLFSHKEYLKLRAAEPGDKTFEDSLCSDNEKFELLQFDFTPADLPHWPEAFSDYLDSYPPRGATPTASHIQFAGTGHNPAFFNCSGVIHAIAPQHGIPGWQRITMMKKWTKFDPALSDSQFPQPDDASGKGFALYSKGDAEDRVVDERCWAYEGVVLPGRMIMLGRWWSPTDQTGEMLETGPWILWKTSDRGDWDED